MAGVRLTIQHNENVFEPPVEEGVKLEYERTGSPGKLTFTTIKIGSGSNTNMSFFEGDPVCLYYDEKLVFLGYVFSKKRKSDHHIEVTCYDQIRYLKNKFCYVFENKTASEIIKALCKDFNLNTGDFDDTKYVIPSVVEENISALDIALDVLEETLLNTGQMYVLYDDCGKITVKNCANMESNTLIDSETAEDFDYKSSIDDETYDSVILYYDPDDQTSGSASSVDGVSGSTSSGASAVVNMAVSQLGTVESPLGSNNIKYNTEYYGGPVSGDSYPWCCVFVWWVFKECGLSSLFNGGEKTAYCPSAVQWFKNQGQWVTGNYQPGDVIFFDWNANGTADHIGIVESASGNVVTCIEGNASNAVSRVNRSSNIIGAGRPNYGTPTTTATKPSVTQSSSKESGFQIFSASDPTNIKQWGTLRYFDKVDTPSIGQNKANALLKLYNKKTRELKVSGAFGDPTIRGGSLIPVRLDLGDIITNNYMLVEKVTHNFDNDHYTMDLTLEGAWE